MTWKTPVPYPVLTASLCDELVERGREAGEKEQAFDTPFRFSGALDCSRKLALRAAGFPATNPMDGPSLLVTTRGTLMHEIVQEAIGKRFPGAQFELKASIEDLTSGHCDCLVEMDGVLVIWELKNVGAFAFSKATGIPGQGYKSMNVPEGPRLSAVVQGGLNALAHGAEKVIIAYISNEAVSVQRARHYKLGEHNRIMAEWVVPREVWEPLALQEIERLKWIRGELHKGIIPEAIAVDDFGRNEGLDPNASRPNWRCEYCSHHDLCAQLPYQPVAIQPVAIRSVQAKVGGVAV